MTNLEHNKIYRDTYSEAYSREYAATYTALIAAGEGEHEAQRTASAAASAEATLAAHKATNDSGDGDDLNEEATVASNYFLHGTSEDDTACVINFTGDETISTTCAICGDRHHTDIFEFFDLMSDVGGLDLHGTTIHCQKCTAERREMREQE